MAQNYVKNHKTISFLHINNILDQQSIDFGIDI